MRNERGFALLAVLLVVAVVSVIGAEFAFSMRLEASAARAYKETVLAAHLAEAGIAQAVREISGDVAYAVLAEDGELTFYTRERLALRRLPRARVPLGPGHFSYRLTDEEARVNLNTTAPDRLERLLEGLGLGKLDRDPIVDSVQDWRDANEEHRPNGAESDDTYLRRPLPYRAKNGNFDSVTELLQVKGVTPALFHGADGRPGLADLLTVKSPGPVNLNTASCAVLRALLVSEAECEQVRQSRHEAPLTAVPGPLAGRGLTVTTRTFRVEAEGLVDGQVRARITAIVQRRGAIAADGVAILEWSGLR